MGYFEEQDLLLNTELYCLFLLSGRSLSNFAAVPLTRTNPRNQCDFQCKGLLVLY